MEDVMKVIESLESGEILFTGTTRNINSPEGGF